MEQKTVNIGGWGLEEWDSNLQAYLLVGPFRTYSISLVDIYNVSRARLKDLTGGIYLGLHKDYFEAREKAWEREELILDQFEKLVNEYGHKIGSTFIGGVTSFVEPKKTNQEILADKIWELLVESLSDLKPWAIQALANYDREFILHDLPIGLENFCQTQRDALLCAFDHAKSPEGFEYWQKVLWPKEQWFDNGW